MKTIGFIGTGNMGSALAKAVVKASPQRSILLANRGREKAEALASELSSLADSLFFRPEVCDNQRIAAEADCIFLGVKPQMMADMLEGIKETLASRSVPPVLVTMAAGLTMEKISQLAGGIYPVIRIMPNTPVSIGKGVILYTANDLVSGDTLAEFLQMLESGGRLAPVPERLIDAGSSVSGCGPAFVYMFIEALADGGVACGLPRKDAMMFAAQMVAGSAEMVLASGQHPGALKDAVCSPGGTTIEGVRTLEEAGFRGAVIDAVIEAFEKNKRL